MDQILQKHPLVFKITSKCTKHWKDCRATSRGPECELHRTERCQEQSSLLSKLTQQLSIHDNWAAAAFSWSNRDFGTCIVSFMDSVWKHLSLVYINMIVIVEVSNCRKQPEKKWCFRQ